MRQTEIRRELAKHRPAQNLRYLVGGSKTKSSSGIGGRISIGRAITVDIKKDQHIPHRWSSNRTLDGYVGCGTITGGPCVAH
jgi:hypothetical protein